MQALALKYRPKNFDELIGQEAVSKSLTHALDENRLGHAYLFSGLRGSGKTSSARIFSKALVCENGPTARPCEKCAHCQMANESRHIDIIEMDAASHRKIDDIRDLIEQTKYNPSMARFKIFIIDEVHMLTREAFNALLKTLEEPPSYVKFILATTDPLKLPATVLSRTQHFRFKQINRYAVLKHLEFILSKENIKYEKEALEILARSGAGSLRDTLTLLDQAIIYTNENITQTAVANMLGLLDPSRIEELLNLVLNADKEGLKSAISELEIYEAEMIIDELIASLKDKFLNSDPRFSLLICERFFRILAQAKGMLNTTSDNGFVLSIMFFMMIEATNLKSIDEAILVAQNEPKSVALKQFEPEISKPKEQNAYEKFLAKIYDRNKNLGDCFKNNTEFVSFENNELKVISNATGDDRELIRSHYNGVLMPLLRSLFGQDAKMSVVKAEPKTTLNTPEDELLRQSIKVPTQQTKPQIQDIRSEILSINANKSEAELEKIRQEGIISSAKMLFGEPKIERI